MKINSEGTTPLLPVWQTLKGLSSRESLALTPSPSAICNEHPLSSTNLLGNSTISPTERNKLSSRINPRTGPRLSEDFDVLDIALANNQGILSDLDNMSPSTDLEKRLMVPPLPLKRPNGLIAPIGFRPNTESVQGFEGESLVITPGSGSEAPLLHTSAKDEDDDDDDVSSPQTVFGNYFINFMHSQVRNLGKKARRRIVTKSGDCNVIPYNVSMRRRKYLQDIFTTLVDTQWRWTLLTFAASFLLSWLAFAVVWFVIVLVHGDLPPGDPETGWMPCVNNIYGFTSCFLFSIETQHTIGYGSRYTTEECPHAIFIMCMQSITGVVIQAFMVGIVLAKLARPKKRGQTLMFSRYACVCRRDGQLCLMFRVGDMRHKSHIIEAHVRAQLIKKCISKEGEVLPLSHVELDIGYDVGEDRIIFIWPTTIVHKINEDSPLYNLAAHEIQSQKFEIIVMLEGIIESTGMTTQARSSYLPNEILWGFRFEPTTSYNKSIGYYTIDYSLFNVTVPVDTPTCSAKDMEEDDSSDSGSSSSKSSSRESTPDTTLVSCVASPSQEITSQHKPLCCCQSSDIHDHLPTTNLWGSSQHPESNCSNSCDLPEPKNPTTRKNPSTNLWDPPQHPESNHSNSCDLPEQNNMTLRNSSGIQIPKPPTNNNNEKMNNFSVDSSSKASSICTDDLSLKSEQTRNGSIVADTWMV